MKFIYPKVLIDDEIFYNEHAYMYGDKKEEKVIFTYVNQKTDKVSPKRDFTYPRALNLAMRRMKDGRYKNYTYEISLQKD